MAQACKVDQTGQFSDLYILYERQATQAPCVGTGSHGLGQCFNHYMQVQLCMVGWMEQSFTA
jgi:hypothetical protein